MTLKISEMLTLTGFFRFNRSGGFPRNLENRLRISRGESFGKRKFRLVDAKSVTGYFVSSKTSFTLLKISIRFFYFLFERQ